MQKEANFPIKMKTKSEYAKKFKPMLYMNQAYSKLVYESGASVVYEENPYVAVVQYRENVYGLLQPQTGGSGDAWMWLIVGPEKCMLIDNAEGLGDIKALVDRISGGKEIIPVVTHYHIDHALGSVRFGKVYCHEAQVAKIDGAFGQHTFDSLVDENGKGIWVDFDKADLPEWKPFEIIGVPEGHKFDLGGGYEIELIELNGHAGDGDSAFLDKQSRILFSGDNMGTGASVCGTISYPIEECSVYKFRQGIEKVLARFDDFDYLFNAHYIPDIEKYVLKDVKEALDSIIADPETYDYIWEQPGRNGRPGVTRYFRNIVGFGGISYYIQK